MFNVKKFQAYIGDAVYGALDGVVTTFAIMASGLGADLPNSILIILGLANLFADGFSMATGSFLSERSEADVLAKQKTEIKEMLKQDPDKAEQQAMVVFDTKNLNKQETSFLNKILKDHPNLVKTILYQQEGISSDTKQPLIAGTVTFVAFIVVGFIPILPVLAVGNRSFWQTLAFVSIVLFIVGALRTKVSDNKWWRGGLEIMIAGIIASLIAFWVGEGLSNLV